ncbi:MAG: hypothetical protein JWO03_2857 [Bacteroidetes bacterium]|nr:hypothetical protein [Bacteroidota bacterium]
MSINPRRDELKAICATLPQQEEGQTVNELLVLMYAEKGYTDLKSLRTWNSEGRVVKKGEKALLLWGRPNQQRQPADGSAAAAPAPEDDEMKFFPLAYVFDITQTNPKNDN